MFLNVKKIFVGQSLIKTIRVLSTVTAKSPDSKFQDEWNKAKNYESIPGLTFLGAITSS